METLLQKLATECHPDTKDRLYAKVAMMAGEIMLFSGAETFRVEETIRYIVNAGGAKVEAVAYSTGIFCEFQSSDGSVLTMVRRVAERSTNLRKICDVNEISRGLCDGSLEAQQAVERLRQVKERAKRSFLQTVLVYISITFFYSYAISGTITDSLAALVASGVIGGVVWWMGRMRLPAFCVNAAAAFAGGSVQLLCRYLIPELNGNIILISAIMPLVPGVAFTTAVRDTLYGDYSSGVARMAEASVAALAIALGIGASMMIF